MKAAATKTWKIECSGKRSTEPKLIVGYMYMVIEADTKEEAEQIANDSLPGFDWTFSSFYGASRLRIADEPATICEYVSGADTWSRKVADES